MQARPWVPLRTAWQHALYGAAGFYRRESPADHFRTSPEASALFAGAVARLAQRLEVRRVVDVGAGSGKLLTDLAAVAPHLDLAGVELRGRPAGLPRCVEWLSAVPRSAATLLLANEVLDNVPCEIVELDRDGDYRLVEVDVASGAERLGAAPPPEVASWVARWWPLSRPGQRAEVGLARDRAWAQLCDLTAGGACIAVDYGHLLGDRPPIGTLAAFRDGRETAVRFDGSCDVCAHVAFDSLAAVAGGQPRRQRDVLAELGVSAERPAVGRATADPRGYLRDLALAGQAAELTARGGLGDFYWLLASSS